MGARFLGVRAFSAGRFCSCFFVIGSFPDRPGNVSLYDANGGSYWLVMPALVAGIHVFALTEGEDVDGRDDARP
jgi:hypothetical protein